eukprot:g21719.t1
MNANFGPEPSPGPKLAFIGPMNANFSPNQLQKFQEFGFFRLCWLLISQKYCKIYSHCANHCYPDKELNYGSCTNTSTRQCQRLHMKRSREEGEQHSSSKRSRQRLGPRAAMDGARGAEVPNQVRCSPYVSPLPISSSNPQKLETGSRYYAPQDYIAFTFEDIINIVSLDFAHSHFTLGDAAVFVQKDRCPLGGYLSSPLAHMKCMCDEAILF